MIRHMKVEEFFSEGLRLAKPEYWTIFFNFLIYFILIVIALVTVIGLLIVPSLAVGLVRFTIRAGRGAKRLMWEILYLGALKMECGGNH